MKVGCDMKQAAAMMFAEDLLDEFERKGYEGRALYLAIVHLWTTCDIKMAGCALQRIDDIVMQAAEITCRKPRRKSSKDGRKRS